ncbi:hypothetical protein : Uncharacterized protein OS=planctomycete KSU-1 GN=KSU1_D0729 PE=4 SV=1 [Gemmataceae bacterium]|nr:hypothetical protein : Uncharacterized protein OS=planctomycete KSU-1 GN=KSU1_D0729 PE=4 SV=1 [Gemmataceae bacterium]VTU01535.1 hypothetical protein : Uncharacterized protein OS=planctomycete KSU-1 GN=KSU1_D0729 PE=4 SV=1 [Gemmataceae bacterium]
MIRTLLLGTSLAGVGGVGWIAAQSPSTPLSEGKKGAPPPESSSLPPGASDVELVERVITARREYESALKALHEHYVKHGDKLRNQWTEQELMGHHMLFKPSYNLDVKDVPPPSLEARVNVREANDLFRTAMEYKGKGLGSDYVLNQRRAEILFREILEKYPNSDKIGDVAYQLGDLYEGRAYKQYDRAAKYFERSYQWVRGSRTDARIRAATLYDRQLNERAKAIEIYRDVLAHDTDAERMKQAERRLAELTGQRK